MKRKCLFLFLCFSILVFAFWLGVWTSWTEARAHYTPEYAKVDLVPILEKEVLKESDYEILFQQTGMTKMGIDELRATGREKELLYLQERFFEEVEVECLRSNLIVQSERLEESESESFLPTLRTGDILISFSGHVFGWRYGHAAIVVDAERGLTVEAVNLGSDSKLRSIEHWKEYPTFALVRPVGIAEEHREAAAKYAKEKLVGIPYSLFSFGRKAEAVLPGTQCAHLVWCAYEHFGYDLDSDGGLIVTPRDIYDSDLLEVVQVYGVNPGECMK